MHPPTSTHTHTHFLANLVLAFRCPHTHTHTGTHLHLHTSLYLFSIQRPTIPPPPPPHTHNFPIQSTSFPKQNFLWIQTTFPNKSTAFSADLRQAHRVKFTADQPVKKKATHLFQNSRQGVREREGGGGGSPREVNGMEVSAVFYWATHTDVCWFSGRQPIPQ